MLKGVSSGFSRVQHLDPDHEGMLVELLRPYSPIPVVQAHDQAQLEPNHVYVVPRGRDLGVNHGVLISTAREPDLKY